MNSSWTKKIVSAGQYKNFFISWPLPDFWICHWSRRMVAFSCALFNVTMETTYWIKTTKKTLISCIFNFSPWYSRQLFPNIKLLLLSLHHLSQSSVYTINYPNLHQYLSQSYCQQYWVECCLATVAMACMCVVQILHGEAICWGEESNGIVHTGE